MTFIRIVLAFQATLNLGAAYNTFGKNAQVFWCSVALGALTLTALMVSF